MLMQVKTDIDFHAVDEKHAGIHRRLENWARWCNGSSGPSSSPMFRLFISPARARGGDIVTFSVPVDRSDAIRISKAVIALPDKHRSAIQWAYVKPVSPRRAAAAIGTSLDGLALYVRDARQMLLNRGA
jgi:hypothetical protein